MTEERDLAAGTRGYGVDDGCDILEVAFDLVRLAVTARASAIDPCTITSAGPRPSTHAAIGVPSAERILIAMQTPSADRAPTRTLPPRGRTRRVVRRR